MLLPNADKAIIKTEKISDYVLNIEHFEGKNKARVFEAVLGLRKEHTDSLIKAIKEAILKTQAVKQSTSSYGTTYIADLELTLNNKTATVRTAWLVENNDEITRLITCYIKF